MPKVESVAGLEILDSRGRPTVQATCTLAGNVTGTASVPSGASTGRAEARELRDNDPNRYGGLGCRKAVENVNTVLNDGLAGHDFDTHQQLDQRLNEMDGSPDKSRLGANALLAVSLAFARACAASRSIPLYKYFAETLGTTLRTLPRPTINLFSGGKHAGGQVVIQDVLVVADAASTIDEALSMTFAVWRAAAELSAEKYDARPLTADEGGLAPPFPSAEAMLEDAVAAIEWAGFQPGRDVSLAVDVAASHFYVDGTYQLGNKRLSSEEMIAQLRSWLDRFPIISLEDGLAEDDWDHWPALRKAVGEKTLVLGDDLLCTNPQRIRRAVETQAANALLLKVNQIGTLTEAAQAYDAARSAGWAVTVSARSGETEDDWLADLAVGWQSDQIKVGSVTQSERLAKYNRLLAIEAETKLPLAHWPESKIVA